MQDSRRVYTTVENYMIDFSKPVQTRDGRSVRIISTAGNEPYPIVGYMGAESVQPVVWTADGRYYRSAGGFPSDLVNVPEESYVYINVHKHNNKLSGALWHSAVMAHRYTDSNIVGRMKVKLEKRFDD